jgi:hypothetical protein
MYAHGYAASAIPGPLRHTRLAQPYGFGSTPMVRWPREDSDRPANRHVFALEVSTKGCTASHESHVSHAYAPLHPVASSRYHPSSRSDRRSSVKQELSRWEAWTAKAMAPPAADQRLIPPEAIDISYLQ